MNLGQFRFLCVVADSDFNITRAAKALHATQPGVSKQIAALERELGVEILVHRGNRIAGFTAPGQAILQVARRMLNDLQTVKRIGEEFRAQDTGQVVIATTYTHARYILPDVLEAFAKNYPKVKIVLKQAYPRDVPHLVAKGDADLGISGEVESTSPDLAMLPCYRLRRSLIAPAGHPVLKLRKVSMASLARYPIIAMDSATMLGRRVADAFTAAGATPTIAMTATDSEIIKWYIARGMGIAILPSVAFDAARDRELRAVDVNHLFAGVTTSCILKRDAYLMRYMLDLIQSLAPHWTPEAVMQVLAGADAAAMPVPDYARPAPPRPARPPRKPARS